MKRLFIFFLLYFILEGQVNYFFTSYGAPGGSEELESIILTSDQKLVIVGGLDSGSNTDLLLIKTDLSGQILWAKSYGGNSDDMGLDIKETWDGGFIIAGWTQSYGQGSFDFWVLKTDKNGNLQWQKTYGGNGAEQAWSVNVIGKNFFVVGGSTSFGAGLSDVLALKLDSLGNILWQKTYGTTGEDAPPGNYSEYVARGQIDINGKFLISGITNGTTNGSFDIFLIKIDPSTGNILWQKTYGDVEDEASWHFLEAGNSYYLTGNYTNPVTFEADCWIVKTDTLGNIIWEKTFGISNTWDEILNVSKTLNENILLASYYEIGNNDWASLGFEVTSAGNLKWANSYKWKHQDWFNACLPLSNNSIVFLGVSTDTTSWSSDMIIVQTDSTGKINNCNLINTINLNVSTTNSSSQNANFTMKTPTISPVNSTATQNNVTLQNTYHCAQNVSLKSQSNSDKIIYLSSNNLLKISLNKISPEVHLIISEITGKKIMDKKCYACKEMIYPVEFSPGIYFVKVQTPYGNLYYKFIKTN